MDTTMPTPVCECGCVGCAAGNCDVCAHENAEVCDCAGCTCPMNKPEEPPMAM